MLENWSTGSKIALFAGAAVSSLYLLGVLASIRAQSARVDSKDDEPSVAESSKPIITKPTALPADKSRENGSNVPSTSAPSVQPPIPPTPSTSQPSTVPSSNKSENKDTKSETQAAASLTPEEEAAAFEAHVQRAWDHWNKLGAPRYHVAPMVDQSELPFRQLCRKYGADAAYSPMLHSRIFSSSKGYREDVFSTCPEDRPLFIQFCGNDPATLLRAARMVEDQCDYVDLNTGCPQRIAKKGHYGAYLMDEWDLLERIIRHLSSNLRTPVSVKIRVFPEIEKTVAYARMFERAGASLLAVHGRTRDQRNPSASRASWDHIKAVKEAVRIPVIANGNVRNIRDAEECLAYTGCDAIMSAESLLADPALFDRRKLDPNYKKDPLEPIRLAREYLEICTEYPTAFRMVRGHLWSILGDWLHEFPQIRTALNDVVDKGDRVAHMLKHVGLLEQEVERIVREEGRTEPKPKMSREERERQARDEARERAIEEQDREASALEAIESCGKEDGDGFEIDFDSLGSL